MIVINSGKMIIPENERFVGFTGDNLHSTKQFIVTDAADENCIYRLYLSFDDGTTNYFVLDSKVENSSTLLTWNVLTEHLYKSGIVNAQIKSFSESGEIYHTSWDYFLVAESAEADEPFKDPENAEFLRYEKELNEIFKKIESGMYVPVERKIAGIDLSKDITVNQLREVLQTYPVIFVPSSPTKLTVGHEKQLCVSDVNSTNPQLFVCAGQLENGDYIWKNLSSSVAKEFLESVLKDYLAENTVYIKGCVPDTRTIAGLELKSDISANQLQSSMSVYPMLFGEGLPDGNKTKAQVGQLYFSSGYGSLHRCYAHSDIGNGNFYTFWEEIYVNTKKKIAGLSMSSDISVEKLQTALGIDNIETALDSIIAMQNNLIGGAAQ